MDFIDPILGLCKGIHDMVELTKTNKERSARLAKRVKALEELVLTIKQRGPAKISDNVVNALKQLCITLTSAKEMMVKFSKSKGFKSFMKSGSHEDNFCTVNEALTDSFQVLSGALQVEQGDIMFRVLENVSQRTQDEQYRSCPPNASPMMPPEPVYCTIDPPPPPFSPVAPMPTPYNQTSSPPFSPVTPMPTPYNQTSRPPFSPVTPMPTPYNQTSGPPFSPVTPMPTPYNQTSGPPFSPVTPMPTPYNQTSRPPFSPVTPMPTPYNQISSPALSPVTPMPTPYNRSSSPVVPRPLFSPSPAMPTPIMMSSAPLYRPQTPVRYVMTTRPAVRTVTPIVRVVSPVSAGTASAIYTPANFSTMSYSIQNPR